MNSTFSALVNFERFMLVDVTAYMKPCYPEKLVATLEQAEEHYSSSRVRITTESIGASGNMFRVFRGIKKPSVIYKDWAFTQIQSKEFERDLLSLKTQDQFDEFHSALGDSLSNHWKGKAGKELILPHKLKLLDLFLKRACELELPHSMMKDNLLSFGHVPLDKWVFNALDAIFSGVLLLTERSMGHVKNEQTYHFYQNLIRQLMRELQPPAIYPALYFEFYAWDIGRTRHSTGGRA